jgi:phosphatidylserine synthase
VALGAGGYWWVIVLSTVAMVLDGVDGRVARRTGTETSSALSSTWISTLP